MENSNCTFYMEGAKTIVRAKIGKVFTFGLAVEIDNGNGGSTMLPGVPSYLLDIDDPNMMLEERLYRLFTNEFVKTIYHPASEWQWRNPDARCLDCGSANYRAMGHDVYRCNDCDKVFGAVVEKV